MAKTKRPAIFLLVGVTNTLIDYLFYTFLTQVIIKGESSIALAGLISGTIALAVAFTTHSLITWRGRSVSRITLLKFTGVTGAGMWILRPVLLTLFLSFHRLYDWAHSVAQLIGISVQYSFIANTGAFGFMAIILLIYNYLTYDRFVYTDRPSGIVRKSRSEP
jgi:putative flippase GtrA